VNILSYVVKGNMIHLTTDHKDYKDFVYFKDKFGTKTALLAEINKKVVEMDKKKTRKAVKYNKLLEELNA